MVNPQSFGQAFGKVATALPSALKFPDSGWQAIKADVPYAVHDVQMIFQPQVLTRLKRLANADNESQCQAAADLFKAFLVRATAQENPARPLLRAMNAAQHAVYGQHRNIAAVAGGLHLFGQDNVLGTARQIVWDYVGEKIGIAA